MPKPKVILYTDGACSGNPGPGGWGAILSCAGHERELCGGEARTTNNRMELTAVIKGLAALKTPCEVTVVTDSKYVADAVEKGWARAWQSRGWMRNAREPALNPDLWETLLALLDRHEVVFSWVKGHAGHPQNERCDRMAVAAYQKFREGPP